MRSPTSRQKPQRAKLGSFPAPTGGLVSNRNLAISRDPKLPPGAAVLENFFPTTTGAMVRRGSVTRAVLPGAGEVASLFGYSSGVVSRFFAASEDGIWDYTTTIGTEGGSLPSAPDRACTSGDWIVVQFATAGGEFLVGVNGADAGGLLYDGATFSDLSITFPAGVVKTLSDLSFVWVFKQRLYFVEKNSLDVWYLPVDQIGGELTLLPLGGVFVNGGTLMWGAAWSLYNSDAGTMSELVVFCTTEGEVAAYQGYSPDPDQDWSKVGTYRIGRPLGKRGIIRVGGDILVATTVGLTSLQQASSLDYAALGQNAVSAAISDDWTTATEDRGSEDWVCHMWPDGQMVVVSPPTPAGLSPVAFVANGGSGAWSKFTGWDAVSLFSQDGQFYFGTRDGVIKRAWVTGSDDGSPYVARYAPLFSDMGASGSLKAAQMARVITRSGFRVTSSIVAKFDFDTSFPSAPAGSSSPVSAVWDFALWDEAMWDNSGETVFQSDWRSVGGSGQDMSAAVQITSAGIVPSDAEIIRVDMTYDLGGLAS